jgi:site-specific DNA-methyltransferase (adenine-specific)
LVWKECYRTLHDGCRLCINIGDQFARAVYYGRYKVIPIREEIIKFAKTSDSIIWELSFGKSNHVEHHGRRHSNGSYPYPRNGILKLDYEFILIFKKLGNSPKPTKSKRTFQLTAEEWNTYFAGHWNFAGARQTGHIAMFPEELTKRLIKMFSFVGETVLDPFAGSGTTALAARNTDRNSVGYEINPEFIPIIKDKLEVRQQDLNGTTYEFVTQAPINIDFEKEIQHLPYIFKDPHTFDKKIDVKQLQFGSKIDKDSPARREEFYTVKEVISPDKIRLNNDLIVKLIGIKADSKNNGKATEYLAKKTKGKRVFLRYDQTKYDSENNLLCYLYLENKTFINAHLIKNKLVEVDSDMDFKYRKNF